MGGPEATQATMANGGWRKTAVAAPPFVICHLPSAICAFAAPPSPGSTRRQRSPGTGSGIEEIRCLQLGQAGPHRGLVGKRMAGGLSWAARLQAQDGPGEPEVLLRRELEIER